MQDTTQDNILVSFEDVKMKDFRAYWMAVAKGDWQGQDEFFAKVVQSWEYDLDPSIADSYGDLSIIEYNVVKLAIRQQSKLAKLELLEQKT